MVLCVCVCVSHITSLRSRSQSAMQSHVIHLQTSPAVQATRLLNPESRGPAAAISNGASAQKAACVPCVEEHPGLADGGVPTTCSARLLPALHEWASGIMLHHQHSPFYGKASATGHRGISSTLCLNYLGPQLHAAAAAKLPLPQERRLHPQPPCNPPGNRSECDRTGDVTRLGQHRCHSHDAGPKNAVT